MINYSHKAFLLVFFKKLQREASPAQQTPTARPWDPASTLSTQVRTPSASTVWGIIVGWAGLGYRYHYRGLGWAGLRPPTARGGNPSTGLGWAIVIIIVIIIVVIIVIVIIIFNCFFAKVCQTKSARKTLRKNRQAEKTTSNFQKLEKERFGKPLGEETGGKLQES